jgi:hypothetical protein
MTTLRELNGSFLSITECGYMPMGTDAHGAQGVTFRCPAPGHTHLILLWFSNPLDAPAPSATIKPFSRWQRIGDSLDTLTLCPSIQVSNDWRGFVLDGKAI